MAKKKPFPVRLMGSLVAVEPINPGETAGGIALPNHAKMGLQLWRVVARGPGVHDTHGNLVPMPIEVGEIVIIKAMPRLLPIGAKEYGLITAGDVQAVVEDPAAFVHHASILGPEKN